MPRPSRFDFRLQNLVLLVMIPGLLLATLLIGGAIYRSVYGIIMTGFDQKLFAVSTVTGAFIRGEDHDALFHAHRIRALTADPAGGEILGADPEARQLFRIDPAHGGALAVDSLPADTRALALDATGARLWVAAGHPAALSVMDLASGRLNPVATLAEVPAGMAYDAKAKLLYAGGERLTTIDPLTGAARPVMVEGLAGPVRAPALDPGSGTLYLLAGDPAELVAVDLKARSARTVGPLSFPPPPEGMAEPLPGPSVHALAIGGGHLLGASDRLVRVDPSTGAVSEEAGNRGFRSPAHPFYQHYVHPMRDIMAKKRITYLYTEAVGLGGRLTYGIDATEGASHSPIGSVEAIADDEIPAMERAMTEGTVRLSGLEEWDAWGLLKTADAPIYRDDGSVAALAGADIDISVILKKTRMALVKVGVVAALTLVLGGLVSLFISRRLVSPLTEVKEGALQLAAGQYGHRIADQPLLELRELSESFNRMSGALSDTIDELTKTNQALETVRRRRSLEVALSDAGDGSEPGPPFLIERSQPRDDRAHTPSGYVHLPGEGGGQVLVWMADPLPYASLEDLRLRREVAALARRAGGWPASAAFLSGVFPRLHCLALLDAATRTVHALAHRPAPVTIVAADGAMREVDLSTTPTYALAPDEWVVLADRETSAAASALRHEQGTTLPSDPGFPQFAVALFGPEVDAAPGPRRGTLPGAVLA